jgi:hypothetical protein
MRLNSLLTGAASIKHAPMTEATAKRHTSQDVSSVYHALAGFSAATFSVILLHPLDAIKVRLQGSIGFLVRVKQV